MPYWARAGFAFMCGLLIRLIFMCQMFLSEIANFLQLTKFKLNYKSRPNDIFIVSYPKSGTTLMQQVLYQLTSDGALDFDHIDEVVPHLEEDLIRARRPMKTGPGPRIFKTHLRYGRIPKGRGKYLYVMRNGMDVAVSYYHHYGSYKNLKAPFERFFGRFLDGKVFCGSWFEHLSDWLGRRGKLNLCIIKYEDLVHRPRETIATIAAFCELSVDADHLDRAVERSGFAYMKQHESKFDMATKLARRVGIRYNAFLREGKTSGWRSWVSEPLAARYRDRFKHHLKGMDVAEYLPKPAPEPGNTANSGAS